MKLKALQSIQGIKPQGEYTHAGEAFEVDEAEGLRLINLGCAKETPDEEEPTAAPDLVDEPPTVENDDVSHAELEPHH